jgi:hypothetical protein
MATASGIAPFVVRDGRLCLEDVDLAELGEALEGRAAWILSHAAIAGAIASAGRSGARCVAVGAIGPPAVLAQLVSAGWWARVHSSHELSLAAAAGFPPERLLAGGGVHDDGFVKDALAAGVALMEHADASERANAARIAALLDHALPPERGAPPDAPVRLLARCGGLLALVLRPPLALAIDAVCPRSRGMAHVLPLEAGDALVPGTLAGLEAASAPHAALVPTHVRRGDRVMVPGPAAAVQPVDPAHPPSATVLVRGASWRLLGARPLPPAQD